MNTQSSSSSNFKVSSVLPYALVVALSSLLCFGFCRFVIDKGIESDINLTKGIAITVIAEENSMKGHLKCATTAMKLYLDNKSNAFPKNKEDLWKLRDDIGAGALSIKDSNGRFIYTTTDVFETKPEFVKSYSSFNICPQQKSMMKSVDEIVYYPLSASANHRKDALAKKWLADKKVFVDAFVYADGIIKTLKDTQKAFGNIESIEVSTPSGIIIADSVGNVDSERISNDVVIENYSEKPIIKDGISSIRVSIPFGGLKDNCAMLKGDGGSYSGAANEAGQYFYVMNVTFDKTELNKQLAIIIVCFIAFTLLACIAVYYINAYIAKSSELTDLSERMGDKVTHLCNTRLGEVRRYVTKIVKDSMRVDNMNKELPEEMVQLLDRAFREVDEKGLISEKNVDVE